MLKKLMILGMVIFCSYNTVFSGVSSEGIVTGIVVENNVAMVNVGTHSSHPSCCTMCTNPKWGDWAFSLDRPDGKAWLSMLMMAKSQKWKVTVIGNKTCNVWGDRETIKIVLVHP